MSCIDVNRIKSLLILIHSIYTKSMNNDIWMKHADGTFSTEISMLSGIGWHEGKDFCFHHPETKSVMRLSECQKHVDGENDVTHWSTKDLEIFND